MGAFMYCGGMQTVAEIKSYFRGTDGREAKLTQLEKALSRTEGGVAIAVSAPVSNVMYEVRRLINEDQ